MSTEAGEYRSLTAPVRLPAWAAHRIRFDSLVHWLREPLAPTEAEAHRSLTAPVRPPAWVAYRIRLVLLVLWLRSAFWR